MHWLTIVRYTYDTGHGFDCWDFWIWFQDVSLKSPSCFKLERDWDFAAFFSTQCWDENIGWVLCSVKVFFAASGDRHSNCLCRFLSGVACQYKEKNLSFFLVPKWARLIWGYLFRAFYKRFWGFFPFNLQTQCCRADHFYQYFLRRWLVVFKHVRYYVVDLQPIQALKRKNKTVFERACNWMDIMLVILTQLPEVTKKKNMNLSPFIRV